MQKDLKETPIINNDGKVEVVKIGLNVETIRGFSGHSDRSQLVSYMKRISSKPERVIVDHGEKRKCLSLAKFFRRNFGVNAFAPSILETLRLK
jgi:hypothetical protein